MVPNHRPFQSSPPAVWAVAGGSGLLGLPAPGCKLHASPAQPSTLLLCACACSTGLVLPRLGTETNLSPFWLHTYVNKRLLNGDARGFSLEAQIEHGKLAQLENLELVTARIELPTSYTHVIYCTCIASLPTGRERLMAIASSG